MSQEREIKDKIKSWIEANKKSGNEIVIDDETKILELKVLSSLKVMELIVYLESLTGKPVNPDNLKPGAFSSINVIYKNFVEGE